MKNLVKFAIVALICVCVPTLAGEGSDRDGGGEHFQRIREDREATARAAAAKQAAIAQAAAHAAALAEQAMQAEHARQAEALRIANQPRTFAFTKPATNTVHDDDAKCQVSVSKDTRLITKISLNSLGNAIGDYTALTEKTAKQVKMIRLSDGNLLVFGLFSDGKIMVQKLSNTCALIGKFTPVGENPSTHSFREFSVGKGSNGDPIVTGIDETTHLPILYKLKGDSLATQSVTLAANEKMNILVPTNDSTGRPILYGISGETGKVCVIHFNPSDLPEEGCTPLGNLKASGIAAGVDAQGNPILFAMNMENQVHQISLTAKGDAKGGFKSIGSSASILKLWSREGSAPVLFAVAPTSGNVFYRTLGLAGENPGPETVILKTQSRALAVDTHSKNPLVYTIDSKDHRPYSTQLLEMAGPTGEPLLGHSAPIAMGTQKTLTLGNNFGLQEVAAVVGIAMAVREVYRDAKADGDIEAIKEKLKDGRAGLWEIQKHMEELAKVREINHQAQVQKDAEARAADAASKENADSNSSRGDKSGSDRAGSAPGFDPNSIERSKI